MSRLMLCGLMSGAILCSSAPVRADDAEDKAVAFVKKLGGEVTRDEKAPGKPVTSLRLRFTQVTDAGLKELSALKNLTNLHLGGTQVTDAGLKELSALTNLIELYLSGTKVTDAGIRELKKALPKCTILKF